MHPKIKQIVESLGGAGRNEDGEQLIPALIGKQIQQFADIIMSDAIDAVLWTDECNTSDLAFEQFREKKHAAIARFIQFRMWPKHKPGTPLHQIIRDGVYRDFTDEQIMEETNYLATREMIAEARFECDQAMERANLMDGTL
jgi:hypothetical protein